MKPALPPSVGFTSLITTSGAMSRAETGASFNRSSASSRKSALAVPLLSPWIATAVLPGDESRGRRLEGDESLPREAAVRPASWSGGEPAFAAFARPISDPLA
jgi:hypothetical protein